MSQPKVVLAFSGGLDTSFCVKYLSEDRGFDVYSVLVDTGGFSEEDLKSIEQNAYSLGVKKHTTIDKTEAYYNECIKYLIFGNILEKHLLPIFGECEKNFPASRVARIARGNGSNCICK